MRHHEDSTILPGDRFLIIAAPAYGQVVETEDGLVQIAGLFRRTPQDIERLLQETSPGTTLSSGACAAVLEYELGFPDAAVIGYTLFLVGRAAKQAATPRVMHASRVSEA